jgi:hypothetical protein
MKRSSALERKSDKLTWVRPAHRRLTIHLNDWIRFFEALAFVNNEGHREIFCAIVGDYMVLSKKPLKRKTAPKQQDLFDSVPSVKRRWRTESSL